MTNVFVDAIAEVILTSGHENGYPVRDADRTKAQRQANAVVDHLQSIRPYDTAVCKGSWTLDTACRQCERCRETAPAEMLPVPMRLHCPECKVLHLDVGAFATKPHHTHACQHCGNVWRPALVATVGVQFLPGFKNDPSSTAT